MKTISKHLVLKDMVTKQHFERIEAVFKRNFNLPIEFCDILGREIRSRCSSNCHPGLCQRIRRSKFGHQRCRQDRLRSLNIALQTGLPHITLCHAGIVLACVPVMNGDLPLGGLFFGKCLWEPFGKTLEADVQTRLRGLHIYAHEILDGLQGLPIVTARQIQKGAEFLYVLLYETADLEPLVRPQPDSPPPPQSNSDIQQIESFGPPHQLIAKIKTGDHAGAKEILNALLDRIVSDTPSNIDLLKARLAELLGMLTRTAAHSGIDVNVLLNKNIDYTHKVLILNTREDICEWTHDVLDDFIKCVYRSQDAKKVSQLKPAIEYMQVYYDQPLTLTDLAGVAKLSVGRFSHLFCQQLGITPIDYLTHIRIDQARRMLLTSEQNCTGIGYEVGFNSQSYFTRVFKQTTGLTPTQFRMQNKRQSP